MRLTMARGYQWLLAFFFLCVFLVAIRSGWEWPYIAKLMPVYVAAVPGLIFCLVQLYRDVTDSGQSKGPSAGIEMDEVFEVKIDPRTATVRTVVFFFWFAGGALGIWLLGIVIALPLLVFLYSLIDGKEKWTTAIILGVCTYGIVWGLFEYMMEMRWPPGLLIGR
jgi:hypothetical protein